MSSILVSPPDFDVKFPNFTANKTIPTYFEIVEFKNGMAYPKDLRAKAYLEEKLGFKFLGPSLDSSVFYVVDDFKEGVVYRKEEEEMKQVLSLEEDSSKQYCKICGGGFSIIDKDHIVNDHDELWEEYQRLPVMIPDIGLVLYWKSNELQEVFPEPMNLLCGYGPWANYLDYLKIEGTRLYKEIADYFNVPFHPKKISSSLKDTNYSVILEYCKICGIVIETIDKLEGHLISHGIDMGKYSTLNKTIPDIGMEMWHKHADLRRAFPEPLDLNKGYGSFKNFMEWLRTDGVKKHPHIRKYFQGK